tara:strand:- start:76 stop:504 length:429 start_codon:yes stop_codon:yes gene_type:complete
MSVQISAASWAAVRDGVADGWSIPPPPPPSAGDAARLVETPTAAPPDDVMQLPPADGAPSPSTAEATLLAPPVEDDIYEWCQDEGHWRGGSLGIAALEGDAPPRRREPEHPALPVAWCARKSGKCWSDWVLERCARTCGICP